MNRIDRLLIQARTLNKEFKEIANKKISLNNFKANLCHFCNLESIDNVLENPKQIFKLMYGGVLNERDKQKNESIDKG